MPNTLNRVGAITLFVDDPQKSKAFYMAVFGVTVMFEDSQSVAFMFGDLCVNFLQREWADELVTPGPVAAADAGSNFQLTIFVDDTNVVIADLASRGVKLLNGPIDRRWGMRTATFVDPDGHVWEIAQQLK